PYFAIILLMRMCLLNMDTTKGLTVIESRLPVSTTVFPPDRHPAHVYIARLGPGSRRTMSEALNTVAAIVTSGRADLETMPWAALRYQHTAAVRSALSGKVQTFDREQNAGGAAWRPEGILAPRLHDRGRLPPCRRRAHHQGTDAAAWPCIGLW